MLGGSSSECYGLQSLYIAANIWETKVAVIVKIETFICREVVQNLTWARVYLGQPIVLRSTLPLCFPVEELMVPNKQIELRPLSIDG